MASLFWPASLGIGVIALLLYGIHEAIGLAVRPRPVPKKDEVLEAAKREVEAIAPEEP